MVLRLRQLQVIHRHGDRAPLMNIFRGSVNAIDEASESRLWMHYLPTSSQLVQIRSKYSVNFNGQTHTLSQQRPYGYLTTRGIEQMTKRGNQLHAICLNEDLRLDKVTSEQVQVFSNAYTRTQISAQALLLGMLEAEPHISPQVSVLPPEQDIINTYAIYPEIMRIKVDLERDNADFVAHEHEMIPIKKELSRLIPAFDSGQIPFSWLTAADYFVCRRAHQVPYIPGTKFYSNKKFLKLVAGRLMHNVLLEMQRARLDCQNHKKMVIYSGHDVSLLSVLRTMDADLANDISFWPEYSSALALGLLEDENGNFFVRAQLNDKALAMGNAPDGILSADRFCELVISNVEDHA
ncbi:uncharacterized protein CCR75_002105 [Bremia lactucae]|uniref:Histidine acid phosphatase n=1 Tax=Bremia lactucae TaxID=4779 RepID=A0A976FDZ9_BRELC|nr:hypothetical protein CCR75_002105 [Bremia lactucae]